MSNSLERYYFEKSFGLRQDIEEDRKSDKEQFDLLCITKVYDGEPAPSDLLLRTKFINITDRINIRHPFLILLEFIEDFFNGEYSRELITKYNILDYVELNYTLENILKLVGNRTKKNIDGSKEKNLAREGWSKIYEFIIKNSRHFRSEQLYLLNFNILRASILIYLLKSSGTIPKNDLNLNLRSIIKEVMDRIHVLNFPDIRSSFLKFTDDNVNLVIDNIVSNLQDRNFLEKSTEDILKLKSRYLDVSSSIIKVLSNSPNGISYDSFYRKVEKENPVLEFIPRTGIIESSLEKLEESRQVFRIHGYWRYQPYKDTLILSTNVEKREKEMRAELEQHSETAFFGRRIGPDSFVDELLEIHKGDLNDTDDQVTRIAGIFLSLSPLLAVRHEKIPLFDFSVTISPKFKEINLIDPNKDAVLDYHILVNIESPITMNLALRIRQSIPESDKAILITLKEVNSEIKQTVFQDRVIVYGYEQLTSLVKRIGKLPSRVNSIAKIMYGNHRNKMVKINSLDYESRMAFVTVLPSNEDITVGLDCLNEIWIGNLNSENIDTYSTNYQQFLSIINRHTERSLFEKGLINPKIENIKCIVKYGEGLEYIERYLDPYDEKQGFFLETHLLGQNSNKLSVDWQIKVDNNTVNIYYDSSRDYNSKEGASSNLLIKEVFHCTCMYWDGIIHSFHLCSHLVTALDLMVKKTDCLNKSWMNGDKNIVTNLLRQFIKLNDRSIIEALVMYIQESDFLKLASFIENLPCLDRRANQSFISTKVKLRDEILKNVNKQSEVFQLFLKMEKGISRMMNTEVQQIVMSLK